MAAIPATAVHLVRQECTKKDMLGLLGMTGQDIQFPKGVGEHTHSV